MSDRTERFDAVAGVIRRRRMRRNFADERVAPELVTELLDVARRAPSAGNTQPFSFLVLTGDDVDAYWDAAMPDQGSRNRFRWQGLLHAPVLVVLFTRPDAYLERYAEPDKAATARGTGPDRWPVPYWWVDAGMVAQNLLLVAEAAGLAGCFFGLFDHEPQVLERFDVPAGQRSVGTVALGWPAPDAPGRSAARPRPALRDIVHHGTW